MAYAKYLSNEFHAHVNQAFKEWSEEKANPGLKIERGIEGYKKAGKDNTWIEARVKGIAQRNALTATMGDHNCKPGGPEGNGYAEATRAISLKVLGRTPKEIRTAKGLPASAATRDHLERHELVRILFAETEAERLIKTEAAYGNSECVDCCRRAGEAVQVAIRSLGRSRVAV